MNTTSMETASTGLLDENKEHHLRSKDKGIWCIKLYTIAYVKIQKNEDLQFVMSNLQPNCCLKALSKKWTNI